MELSLYNLNCGQSATIVNITADKNIAYKLARLGFVVGASITLVKKSLFNQTFLVELSGSFFAVRKEIILCILVK